MQKQFVSCLLVKFVAGIYADDLQLEAGLVSNPSNVLQKQQRVNFKNKFIHAHQR